MVAQNLVLKFEMFNYHRVEKYRIPVVVHKLEL